MAGSKSVIYEGEQVLRQKFTGKNGSITINITYQACDSHACLMPKTKTLKSEYNKIREIHLIQERLWNN